MKRFYSSIYRYTEKAPVRSLLFNSLLFFLIGCGVSFGYSVFSLKPLTPGVPTRLAQTEYPLINPLLFCSIEQVSSSLDTPLKQKIINFVKNRISIGDAQNISVYIQEYGKGKWVGVNENDRYDPASLLKVPLMITYYQMAEKDPNILSQQILFNGVDQNTDEYFKSSNDIVSGKFYTINQLITSMIVNSDNTATILLSNYINKSSLFDVYTDLGLPTPPTDPTVQYISAKSYAYFFRILYNATYVTRPYSQQALELLSEGHLPNGIKSALPSDLIVADKFGERSIYDQNYLLVNRELHDCGIVYKPGSPYLLCVMTRGTDFSKLSNSIHDLSTLVYQNVSTK